MERKAHTQKVVMLGLFAAIILILAYTPIGYIPLGFTRATTIHIPVIIASIVLGPQMGAILGALFGLTSFINNTFLNPTITSFVFTPFYSVGTTSGNLWSLVICFVPRILIGVVPYYVNKLFNHLFKGKKITVSLAIASFAGSMTNTLLVMNMIYIFFGDAYAVAREWDANAIYGAVLAVIGVNGVPEALVAMLICTAVIIALQKAGYVKQQQKS